MVAESCKHQSELDELVNTAGLQNVQPFDPHLARILITELLWGKGYLKPENARAIRIILELENDLRQALDSMNSQEENDSVHQVSGRLIHSVLFCICIRSIVCIHFISDFNFFCCCGIPQ